MKALRFSSFGDLTDRLHVEDLPTPVPGPDEVLVKVYAASLNPSDWKNVLGQYKKTVLPRTPGQDFAGVVVAGDKEMIGQEIWATGGDVGFTRDGSHAEYVVIPKKAARPKPKTLVLQRGGMRGQDLHHGLRRVDRKGATAGGGDGARHRRKRRRGKLRRQACENEISPCHRGGSPGSRSGNGAQVGDSIWPSAASPMIFSDRVKQFTQGKGVNVAFDCVGGPLFEVSLKTLAPGGRQVNIVSVGERRVSFDLVDFFIRRLSLFGLSTLSFDSVASADILDKLQPAFEQGKLTAPDIARTCSIDEAVEAYREGAGGAARGKIVIVFPH